VPQITDDPLEAISVRLIRRADEPIVAAQGSVASLPRARASSRRGLSQHGSP
jgi:hypothetical protein